MSFPEPLIECAACSPAHAPFSNTTPRLRAITPGWTNSHDDGVAALVPFLERVYQRPQGEMLHALCDSLAPFIATCPPSSQEKLSVIFSALLTRQGVSVWHSVSAFARRQTFAIAMYCAHVSGSSHQLPHHYQRYRKQEHATTSER